LIPKFYFPGGRAASALELKSHEENLNRIFDKGAITDLKPLLSQIMKIPTIFKDMVATRIKKTHPTAFVGDKLLKAGFV